jgi:hypothetical protein
VQPAGVVVVQVADGQRDDVVGIDPTRSNATSTLSPASPTSSSCT